MNTNLLRSLARMFEDLPHGAVIMADETYLKCYTDRVDGDGQSVFVPSYSLGAFSAQEVAEMILDSGYDWNIITPKN